MRTSASDPIYLTFDDGPDPEWTPLILDLLEQTGAIATFFAIGRQAVRHPVLVRRIAARGHALGNHTYSHAHPWFMTTRAARAEVRDGAAALSDVLGDAPKFYRPPHGRKRACMEEEAVSQGMKTVMWDLSAIDWGPMGSSTRIQDRLSRARPGHIVLMHDGRNRHNRPDQLVRVLPGFLDSLRGRELIPLRLTVDS